MTLEAGLTLLVLAGAVTLFVTEKLPVDVVGMLVLASLLVLGLVSPAEALSGFSSEATITVAAMFVLSAGLAGTGALRSVARLLSSVRNPTLFLIAVLVITGGLSAFVNNTAIVAVMLPMVLAACASTRQSSSQVLIPMSYAAQMGGVCTLIGTSTNLLVNSLAKDLGHPGFGLFEFTPLGLIVMSVGFTYMLLFRRFLLPNHSIAPLTEAYDLRKYITELRVMPGSPLIGKSVNESGLDREHSVYVLELLRGTEKHWSPRAERLLEGDLLLVRGDWQRLSDLKDKVKLEIDAKFRVADQQFSGEDGEDAQVLVEALIAPGSTLIDQSLAELNFARAYNANVLAMQRRGEMLRDKLRDINLNVGDVLLMMCPRSELNMLRANRNFVILSERGQERIPRHKAWLATGIMVMTIAIAAFGLLPIVASAILGVIALVATRCIGNDQAYAAIEWRVIVLLASVLPLGIAMQKSGLALSAAEAAISLVGHFGPIAVLAVIYGMTALLTEFMSNNAAAVLTAPIAYATAVSLEVSPAPFLVAVMFAASTAFSTPVGYQTNTMVYSAGRYRFVDFMKIGIPLNLLFWGVGMVCIPWFFPF